MISIDINCDLGESYGHFKMGNDELVFPLISSCNIACGFHGGDPLHIENTIKKAIQHQVQIGAHPSYPDLAGFGRRKMILSAQELKANIKYQIAALEGMVKSIGGTLKYIKAHGALYNSIAKDEREAKIFLSAVKEINPELAILGLANSLFQEITHQEGLQFIKEGFLDRQYKEDGSLVERQEKGAILATVEDSLHQFESIAKRSEVRTLNGRVIPMKVDSLCIHGDNPLIEKILHAIQKLGSNIKLKSIEI